MGDGNEPQPGVMHPVDKAFYDLVIKERDYARLQVENRNRLIRELEAEVTRLSTTDPVSQAVDVLFAHRHTLPPDVLRSMQDIWTCASAARSGEPFEVRTWAEIRAEIAAHDTAACERDNAHG